MSRSRKPSKDSSADTGGLPSAGAAPPLDPVVFREAMRHHAGAVTVIATGATGARTGLTATAVCALSDSPAMILACVNRNASGHKLIRAARCFSVNLLAADQGDIANVFAGRAGLVGEARFSGGPWDTLATGAPVLRDALAVLDCDLAAEHEFQTHSIFIGLVRATRARQEADPLLYFRGSFRTLGRS